MEEIKLMHGDCLELMKDIPGNSIDMVLTDPPYGMGFQSNHRQLKHRNIENDDNLLWLDNFSREIHRVVKNNTAHYVFCSFHNIDKFKQSLQKFFKIKNILTWEKNNTGMGDLKADFAPKTEFIIFIQKGRRLINGSRDPNIMRFKRTGNKLHPTQKPVELCKYLVEKFSDKGQVVFDPFMGSGSTGAACKNINRNFIGIEKDDHYFAIAQERLDQMNSYEEIYKNG